MTVRKTFEVTGKKLFLCDMRPGFSEDGVECALPNGNYELSIEPSQSGKIRGFSLVLAGETPDGHLNKGTFSIDMARVGILDRKTFLEFFDGSWEALFDWSESASDSKNSDWGGFLHHEKAGLEAFYVNIGSDCECVVQSLRSGTKTVGVRVIPKPSTAHSTDEPVSRQWTQLEVKCSGITDPWNFCDDWDYEPEIEGVLEDVVLEVSSVDEDDSLTFLDTKSIDPDAAISTYRRRFKGIESITVFLEHSEEEDWKRLSIPKSYSIPQLGAETTSRELAKTVFEIFENARTWT
jgi:hypothetical protein